MVVQFYHLHGMDVIGQIQGQALEELWSWVRSALADFSLRSLPLSATAIRSRYAPKRLVKCFGISSNLQSIAKGRAQLLQADDPGERIRSLGDRLLPGWHSLLVCGGDTSINWHRDHGHFEGMAVMVNLGEAYYLEQDYEQGILQHHLTDGLVVRINTKLLHKAIPISDPRCNLTFRHIKPEFLPAIAHPPATQLKLPV